MKNIKQNMRIVAVLAFVMIALFWIAYTGGTGDIETPATETACAFTLILWSILLEALPFVLLGTLVSSLIQLYVSQETLLKLLPKSKWMQLVLASLIGLVFPVCECAIIPITRGLIKKGMPIGTAMAFMVAVPIINPIVIFSTYSAFAPDATMALLRPLVGFVAALLIGFIAGRTDRTAALKDVVDAHVCGCGHDHSENPLNEHGNERLSKRLMSGAIRVLAHTGDELKSVGAYLIFGASIAASMQIFVPRSLLMGIGGGRISSILVMMALAFVLSLCSEADAFVASTFTTAFSGASILAFLITGPMIDIKNTMMLLGSFKKRFVLKIVLLIFAVCFALALFVSFFFGGGQ